MNKELQKIITDRRNWLSREAIQDWNDSDTAFVSEKYCEAKDAEIKELKEYIKNLKNNIATFTI